MTSASRRPAGSAAVATRNPFGIWGDVGVQGAERLGGEGRDLGGCSEAGPHLGQLAGDLGGLDSGLGVLGAGLAFAGGGAVPVAVQVGRGSPGRCPPRRAARRVRRAAAALRGWPRRRRRCGPGPGPKCRAPCGSARACAAARRARSRRCRCRCRRASPPGRRWRAGRTGPRGPRAARAGSGSRPGRSGRRPGSWPAGSRPRTGSRWRPGPGAGPRPWSAP